MGSVYKVKPEIENFIVAQKKADPRLSCRKLVDIVKQQFGAKLSKSSINTVLKSASLSSPVGRRSGPEGGTRSARQRAGHVEGPEIHGRMGQTPGQGNGPTIPDKSRTAGSEVVQGQEMSKNISLDISKHIKPAFPHTKEQIDGAGTYFLKAVEEEFVGKPLIGQILREGCSGQLKNPDAAGRVLTLGPVFGAPGIKEFQDYTGRGLWALSEAKGRGVLRDLEKAVQTWAGGEEPAARLSIEISQALTEATALRLSFENGTDILVDARCGATWPVDACPSFAVALHRGVGAATEQIISNRHPLVLGTPAAQKDISREFAVLANGFENAPGFRLVRVSVLDGNGRETAGFSTIPHKRRLFMAGIWPWQTDFAALVESGKKASVAAFRGQDCGGPFFYRETFFLHERNYRAVLVGRQPGEDVICAVITNAGSDEMPAESVLETFARAWPHMGANVHMRMIQAHVLQEDIPPDYSRPGSMGMPEDFWVDAVSEDPSARSMPFVLGQMWLEALHHQCLRLFFPPTLENKGFKEMATAVYALPGHVVYEKQRVKIGLVAHAGHPFRDALGFAANRVSERAIIDGEGRQLEFDII